MPCRARGAGRGAAVPLLITRAAYQLSKRGWTAEVEKAGAHCTRQNDGGKEIGGSCDIFGRDESERSRGRSTGAWW